MMADVLIKVAERMDTSFNLWAQLSDFALNILEEDFINLSITKSIIM